MVNAMLILVVVVGQEVASIRPNEASLVRI